MGENGWRTSWRKRTLHDRASDGTVSTDLVRILLGGAPLAQGAVADILEQAGIDPSLLGRSHERIPVQQLVIIWTELERAADDPNLGLHLGELRHGLPTGHVLFSVMLNSPSLGQALERYCRYHDIMGDFVKPALVVRGATTIMGLSTRAEAVLHRQHVECIFSLLATILSHLSGAPFKGEVRFAHGRPADISEHLRVFGPSVCFDQPNNELALESAYLDQPIAAADEELLRVVERYAQRLLGRIQPATEWSSKVAELLSRNLCDGRLSLPRVARLLGLGQRSLQGRLKEEGTTYQAVLDNVRRQLAQAYLEEDALSLAEIAFLLGFADQSAFNHAFRRWTGDSPIRFRERNQL